MATNLELYEALKLHVGEVAARMIAERLSMSEHAATRGDLQALKGDIHAMEARIFRWMLGFSATLWLGNAALIVTIVLKF